MIYQSSRGSTSTTSTGYTALSEDDTTLFRCPNLILDSSCNLFRSYYGSLSQLLAQLQSLPLPVTSLDFSPNTETSLRSNEAGISVGTKVRMTGSALGSGRGELRAKKVRESLRRSLEIINTRKLSYLIAPRIDVEISVSELAGSFGGLVGEGVVEMWGVRQFPLIDVVNTVKTCQRRGFQNPRIYEGEYNVVSRPGDQLIEFLRAEDIKFHAFA